MKWLGQYIYNNALAIDQYINAVLLGDPDLSLSSRCAFALRKDQPKWFVLPLSKFIDWVFEILFNEKEHVKNAYEEHEDNSKELWKWYKD